MCCDNAVFKETNSPGNSQKEQNGPTLTFQNLLLVPRYCTELNLLRISAHSVFGKFDGWKANVKKKKTTGNNKKDFKINNKVPVKFPF